MRRLMLEGETEIPIRQASFIDRTSRILRWRNFYAIPIFIVPIASSFLQLVLSRQLDVVDIKNGLLCDIAEPNW